MLEKIKQEIVVIIISISSMLITAFATLTGVYISNQSNLELQNRQFGIEEAKKEIDRLDNFSNITADIYNRYYRITIVENGKVNEELENKINQISHELLFTDKELYEYYKKFVTLIYKNDSDEIMKAYIEIQFQINKKKKKIRNSIITPL
ncbi:hypothetical protein O8C96_04470 [Aliarcobacter butzleri]|uniref:hypothetical protein n=1 Tax=Aliarcobacter butzleri TaxID=28197 RepID=UPI00263EECAB|nr:hypothetical protein [Aliarcobacter butzleri]MDN5044976.1 hypothetical protein [Aliarcobacter butzleri]